MVDQSKTFLLEIVTPDRLLMREEVEMVLCPGVEGEFGVLTGHAPFISTLKVGELSYMQGGHTHFFAINWGYAEVDPRHVIVLAEGAERAEEIDVERARAALERARERLTRGGPDLDVARAEAAAARATTRLEVAKKRRIAPGE